MASPKLGLACDLTTMEWQPESALAAGSRWFIVGQWALNVETEATRDLGQGSRVLWAAWCADGIHVATLQADQWGEERISVCHVESGNQIACLDCMTMPRWFGGEIAACEAGMYISSKAGGVLVPESPQAVSLCRLPSLEKVAQLVSPEVANVNDAPTELYSMGWAGHGSHIAIAWHAWCDRRKVVTIHSGCDGSLLHTLRVPLSRYEDTWWCMDFTVCPDQPLAAAAWRSDDADIILMHLATGTLTGLLRPHNSSWICFDGEDGYEGDEPMREGGRMVELIWAPGGQHVMMHEHLGSNEDWNIYTVPGEWCGPQGHAVALSVPPVWSSTGSLCIVSDATRTHALDFTASPPVEVPYFDCNFRISDFALDTTHFAFVPGTQNLVQFEGDCNSKQQSPGTAVHHWVYNASAGRSLHCEVPGVGLEPKGSMMAASVAWHPSMESAAVYAVAEQGANVAVHLIDARRHCRLITWTCKELESILVQPCHPTFSAWSQDGKKLALVNYRGTVILKFACEPLE